MSMIGRWRWVAGLILGLTSVGSASAQGVPSVLPLPELPPTPASTAAPIVETVPVVQRTPAVVEVPPGGVGPTWLPGPIDPVALERKHEPGFVRAKARSWHWRRLQGKFWGYPEEYEPRPLGASLYDHAKIMTANGAAARMVLYRYDFLEGSSELSPRGQDQLAKIAAQLAVSPFPMIVERTPSHPSLAESRRYAVLAALARGPCPVPSDRVLVGVPTPIGMSGADAYIISNNSLGRTQQYGPPIPLLSNGVNSPSTVTNSAGSVP
jgi:hypothetical protein